MLTDKFGRHISYLRLAVTDRCNLRCKYCMPAEGVELMHHTDILRFHEIVETIEYAVSQGVDKVRITGGEPLVRKGITDLVAMISKIKGIKTPFIQIVVWHLKNEAIINNINFVKKE